jgi:ketosteroid isomerase-like protein
MDQGEKDNLAAIERLSAGFERHDVDAILTTFADDGIFESLFSLLPDVQFTEAVNWVAGNRGVSEWTCVATTPRGRPLRVRGCDLFEFRDGLITRKDSYFKKIVRRDPS